LPAASIDQIDQLQQKPEVWLADISANADRDGRYQLLAVYDLIRADQKFAQIKLDKSLELIGAELNGRFARLQRTKPGSWEAQLVNTSLPQRLVLLCRMTMPSKSLKAPRLENFTVRRTIWSIYPYGVEAVIDTTSLKPISPSQRESERLLQMDQMLQSSIIPGWHGSTETLLRWYRPWAQRLWSSAGRHLHSNRDAVRNREITQVLQAHRKAIESLNADSVWDEIRSGDAGAQWTDIWSNNQPKMAQKSQRIGAADTWVGSIPLEKPSSLSGAVPWAAISVVLAMGLIGWWSLQFELPNRLFAAPGAWSVVAAGIALLIGGAVVVSVLLLVLGMMLSLPIQRLGLRAAASGKTPSAIQTPASSKLL
jgi:hypothetical protein